MQKVHVFKTKQLQDRIDELKHMEVECNNLREEISTMRHESSFQEKETQIVELKEKITRYEVVYEDTNNRHRSLQRQNDELRMKHQNLVMEMDDLRRIADKDRKSRRQSTHDDRRGGLFDTRDKEIMTDPSSADCACREMDAQIKEMRKQLLVKECQLNTHKMMPNPLKNDVVELRQLVRERESQINKLQHELCTLSSSLDQELKRTDKRCNVCAKQQRLKSLRSDKAVGTERNDLQEGASVNSMVQQEQARRLEECQEELAKLKEKYQSMKRVCQMRNKQIVSLNENIVEKENESCNANKSVQQEVSILKRQLKETEDKCLQIQKLYQSKCESAKSLEKTIQNGDHEILRTKYEKYKTMAIALMEQNEELKRKLPPSN
ncbi:AAEL014736-PA [Aedes aegypti]|uniref:AAEL014736-PA n=1 Tax=Aedes aegypti TaxID=7159 RepID=Q16FJ4_AEDAE|nr:AAEL014736-PA [Aedes aegypti]